MYKLNDENSEGENLIAVYRSKIEQLLEKIQKHLSEKNSESSIFLAEYIK